MVKRKKAVVTYEVAIIPSDGSAARTYSGLTKGKVISALVALCAGVALISTLLIALTPIRTLLPGYGDADRYQKLLLENQMRLDSLSSRLMLFDAYSRKLRTVLGALSDTNAKGTPSMPSRTRAGVAVSLPSDAYASLSRKAPETFLGFLVQGTPSQPFRRERSHYGLDIATALNEPIGAIADGTVIFADWTDDYGYTLILWHGSYLSFYKHCNAVLVRDGEPVLKGQIVALTGNTGRESSAPHLHLEIWKDGIPQDPELYLSK
ncbi:MAG: M23 family metallopeptidase [Chloroherpetonaceae bacterium]|nr:M23 family metallopeptidase [Chloroherpetonaceae bacterium]MCS7211900.1 M23 family metallopeptidase [Chloroherpetonaceae bacterium]MDW8019661.1 M23 family metallopeptidase [Chloroherpetonaceae bacterium]MDW8465266.1 M23 family metallopeptidase [Chloroherpetonaceae bacterium]